MTVKDVETARKAHPDAVLLAHPECRPEVVAMADVVASTSGMLRHVAQAKEQEFIIGTEIGILHPMQKAAPHKTLYPASKKMSCKNMKKISMEDVLRSLEEMSGEVKVDEDIRIPALKAVQAMIDLKI